MKILKRLEPKFFRQFNHYLLTHHPFIWKTRVQYFLFYSLLAANGALAIIALLIPVSLQNVPDYNGMFGHSIFMAMLGGIVYLLWLFLLNRDKQALYSLGRAAQAFGLYLLATACLLSNTLTIPLVLKHRVNALVDSQQLAQDLEYLSYEFWELKRFREYQEYLRNNESILLSFDFATGRIEASNMHLEPGEYLEEDAYKPSNQDITKALNQARSFEYAQAQLLVDAVEDYSREMFYEGSEVSQELTLENRKKTLNQLKNLKGIQAEFHKALIHNFQKCLGFHTDPETNKKVLNHISFYYNAALYAKPMTQAMFAYYAVDPLHASGLSHKLYNLDNYDLMQTLPVLGNYSRLLQDEYCSKTAQDKKECYQEKLMESQENHRENTQSFFAFLISFWMILGVVALQASMMGTMNIQKLALIAALSILGFISLAFAMDVSRDLERYFQVYLGSRHREVFVFFLFQSAILGLLGGVLAFLHRYSGQRTQFFSVLQTAGLLIFSVCHLVFWSFIQNEYYHYEVEVRVFQGLMLFSAVAMVSLSFLIQRRISALPRKS